MLCPNCQQGLPDDAIFCNRCGKRMQAPLAHWQASAQSQVNQVPMRQSAPVQDPYNSQLRPGSAMAQEPYIDIFGLTGPQMAVPLAPPTPPLARVSPPLSALQRFLIRVFQPSLAGNALFGVVAGSIIAVIAGLTGSWLLLMLAHAITPAMLLRTGEDTIDSILGIIPLHAPFRDSLQLFLVIQGVGFHINETGTSSTGVSITSFGPLHGLLIVPALFLCAGGYIAASTDLRNQVQSSLWRGAAISIPYTLILFIVSSQVSGNVPSSLCIQGVSQCTFMMDTTTLLTSGLLWGGLFGLLGASLKLAGGQWRHMIHCYLRTNAHPQIAGMIAGGCYASILGPGLSLLAFWGFLAYTLLSLPWLASNICILGNWQLVTVWGIAQAPLHALNLFFFALGAPITIHSTQTISSCFYPGMPQTTFSLRDQSLHLAPWFYAVLLIPALSLFMGGRVSASISGVQGKGPAAISGGLIAVPFTVVMLLLTFVSTVTKTMTAVNSAGTSAVPLATQSAGVTASNLLLWALLGSAVFGALGGIYEVSAAKNLGRQMLLLLVSIPELPEKPLYLLFDLLCKQPSSVRRSSTRRLVYSALCYALFLAIATAGVGWFLIADNQTITMQESQLLRDIISVLLITIPGLLLFCAGATALCHDPVENRQHNPPLV